MGFRRFDRSRLKLSPLRERESLLDRSILIWPSAQPPAGPHPEIVEIARAIGKARLQSSPVILMMGAHLLRAGVAPLLIDLMDKGLISHVAMNGAGPIHDFEMALTGRTTESVSRYIREGQFGLWKETGRINEIVRNGIQNGLGFGESVGKAIEEEFFPHRDISVLAAGYRLRIPVTVHIGIGYDIIHEHPSCDGGALGAASYDDFLVFVEAVRGLEGGVVLNFGSAVMGPEVYLKALAMARNVARQSNQVISHFTTAVFDLVDLGRRLDREAPRNHPHYYFRPFKTLLLRTVQDGGKSHYIRGEHRVTFPSLYHALIDEKPREQSI